MANLFPAFVSGILFREFLIWLGTDNIWYTIGYFVATFAVSWYAMTVNTDDDFRLQKILNILEERK